MMRAAILMGALAVAIPAAATPQDEPSKELRAKLRSIRVDVDFSNFSVAQLADYLRDVAGINIVVDPKADEIKTLAMKARGVTIQSILNLLLKPHGIGFAVEDGVLKIVPESKLKSEVRLEIIDVRDLLMPIRDFPGVDITLNEDTSGATFNAAPDDARPEFPIVELLKAHTGGKTWDENPKASLQLMNGLLVIKQTPEVIAQIRKILGSLRQYK